MQIIIDTNNMIKDDTVRKGELRKDIHELLKQYGYCKNEVCVRVDVKK